MTKELLFTLLKEFRVFELALLLISYWFTWWIILALGLKLLEVKVGKNILLGTLGAAVCSLFIKPLLPEAFAVLVLVLSCILLLRFYGKAKLLVCCWLTFLILLITIVGASIIDNSLCTLNKNIVHFLFDIPLGQFIIVLAEITIPGIILLLLSIFNISLIPSIENILATVNFLDVYLFGALFYWFYNSSMRFLTSLVNNPGHVKQSMIIEWVVSGGAVIGICIRQINIKKIQKKIATNEQEKILLQNKIQELANTNQELNEKVLNMQKSDSKTGDSRPLDTDNLLFIKQKTYKIPDKNGNPDKLEINSSELSVLLLIGRGKSNKEIVAETRLSEGTVKNIVSQLLSKLKCAGRTQLALYVTKNNIINILNKE